MKQFSSVLENPLESKFSSVFKECIEMKVPRLCKQHSVVNLRAHGLKQPSIMSRQMCIWLVITSWIIGFVHSPSQPVLIVKLPFCGPTALDSFFCDIPLVIKLACMDTYVLEMLINADAGVLATIYFILLVTSYSYILFTVCLYSKDGASKALSTCTAHITVVVLFFGPCIFIYLRPLSTTWVDKFLAVFYAVITALLNPAIYTLRNKEIKYAMKRLRC
ncbi:olfactory receptor 4K3-like [Echinops telfairi]|uniref:Olfactory receptor 4K3-like n=1 Tax=Echinops telfairi TaxID=9371 RepID=A0ABM1VJ60_ECHTE|nr:olfactory receptor 4K3-like [Echinops telfairi]